VEQLTAMTASDNLDQTGHATKLKPQGTSNSDDSVVQHPSFSRFPMPTYSRDISPTTALTKPATLPGEPLPFEKTAATKPQPPAPARWLRALPMVAVFLAGLVGLTRLAVHTLDPRPNAIGPSVHGDVVSLAIVAVWVPHTMIDFAMDTQSWKNIQDYGDLKAVLDARELKNLWYVLVFRFNRADGFFEDAVHIRRPYHEPTVSIATLQNTLTLLIGSRPHYRNEDWSTTTIRVIPDNLCDDFPRDAVYTLLSNPNRFDESQ
jgi:hypothetical protein